MKSIVGHTSAANGNAASEDSVEEQREEITASGDIHVTWQHEAKTIASYAAPLVVTFSLQYSVDVSSIVAAGRIGKIDLGAVSCQLVLSSYR